MLKKRQIVLELICVMLITLRLRDIFLNYTGVYIIITVIEVLYIRMKSSKATNTN